MCELIRLPTAIRCVAAPAEASQSSSTGADKDADLGDSAKSSTSPPEMTTAGHRRITLCHDCRKGTSQDRLVTNTGTATGSSLDGDALKMVRTKHQSAQFQVDDGRRLRASTTMPVIGER